MVAIGIDLGSTKSCIGVWQNGCVQIIPNEQGDRTTPSCIAFTSSERLIGENAKNQIAINPSSSIFNVKRLIGRKFHDPKIQEEIRTWPFAVVYEGGKPKINVQFKDEWKTFTPEEITAMTIAKMKETAEEFLGTAVKDAVISVPAYFNDSQRQATKNAARIAGLNVLRLINEPTASALTYGMDKNFHGERKVLIFDLGGGTLDVSVLAIDRGLFEVLSTSGDAHFGGIDFDNKLMNYFLEIFETNYKKDLRTNPRAMSRLRTAAEKAKISLSYSTEVRVDIEALHEGIDFFTVITRSKFEELCSDYFNRIFQHLDRSLNDANINKCAIDDIVLVGGSTRIPKIQSLLRSYFFGKHLNMWINPDEAVASGAATQAALLSGVRDPKLENLLIVDVIPMSLGVFGSCVIEKNARIPCKKTISFSTFADNQVVINMNVFEDNNLLGSFDLCGIPPATMGVPKIKVTFDVDSDGIVNVSASAKIANSIHRNLLIKSDNFYLSEDEIAVLASEAEEYRQGDEIQKKMVKVRNHFEGHILCLKQCVVKLSDPDRIQLKMLCDEALIWLESNIQADAEDYEQKMNDFVHLCRPILANAYRNQTRMSCGQYLMTGREFPVIEETN